MTRVTLRDESELRVFAAAFASRLHVGDVVALSGPLGSGKTTFVRAAVRALHGDDPVTSPTFTFWHRYDGTPPIDHVDLFRVEDRSELRELGLDDAFAGASIAFVEWWEKAPAILPDRTYRLRISGAGDAPRTIELSEPQ